MVLTERFELDPSNPAKVEQVPGQHDGSICQLFGEGDRLAQRRGQSEHRRRVASSQGLLRFHVANDGTPPKLPCCRTAREIDLIASSTLEQRRKVASAVERGAEAIPRPPIRIFSAGALRIAEQLRINLRQPLGNSAEVRRNERVLVVRSDW